MNVHYPAHEDDGLVCASHSLLKFRRAPLVAELLLKYSMTDSFV